jgi:hypothetical protein
MTPTSPKVFRILELLIAKSPRLNWRRVSDIPGGDGYCCSVREMLINEISVSKTGVVVIEGHPALSEELNWIDSTLRKQLYTAAKKSVDLDRVYSEVMADLEKL